MSAATRPTTLYYYTCSIILIHYTILAYLRYLLWSERRACGALITRSVVLVRQIMIWHGLAVVGSLHCTTLQANGEGYLCHVLWSELHAGGAERIGADDTIPRNLFYDSTTTLY